VDHPLPARCHGAWLALVVASVLVPWWLAGDAARYVLGAGALWGAAWPVLIGVAVAAVFFARSRAPVDPERAAPRIPAGDLLALVAPLGPPLARVLRIAGTQPWSWLAVHWEHVRTGWQQQRVMAMRAAADAEWRLRRSAGVVAIVLLLLLGVLAS
jgi:hypothetical protein